MRDNMQNDISQLDNRQKRRKNLFLVFFIFIGFMVSIINMYIILLSMEVWAYLLIIFLIIIPTVIIGLKLRIWAYGYLFGYAIAGFFGIFLFDMFIGAYTIAVSALIFIILWLIFFKTWRSISKIKVE